VGREGDGDRDGPKTGDKERERNRRTTAERSEGRRTAQRACIGDGEPRACSGEYRRWLRRGCRSPQGSYGSHDLRVWVPKTRPGPLTCGFAGAAGGCDGSPELRDPREWPCPSVARLIARESAARAQRSNCFALIAGLAVRSYWSCASAFGRTAGTATDPITARETPAQHARTSFRHPQGRCG
jgi:hypothetical protein